MNILKIDSLIFNVLSRVCDIMILNILWILCSIPVITVGTSTTALYYCMLKINRKEDYGIIKMFFHSLCQNLKQGCILTLFFIVSGLLLFIDFRICKHMDGSIGSPLMIALALLSIVWGLMVSYAFPILAQFDNSVINILKNSVLMSISNIRSIPIVVFNAVPIILFVGLPQIFVMSIPVVLCVGVAFIAFINSKMLINVFDKYI